MGKSFVYYIRLLQTLTINRILIIKIKIIMIIIVIVIISNISLIILVNEIVQKVQIHLQDIPSSASTCPALHIHLLPVGLTTQSCEHPALFSHGDGPEIEM